jgi:hypothetical protein
MIDLELSDYHCKIKFFDFEEISRRRRSFIKTKNQALSFGD